MVVIMVIAAVILAAVLLQAKAPAVSSRELEKILPIWKLEQGALLSKSGDITLGLRLELPEIFSLSNQEYEALHHAWLKAIKMLPAGTVLHKQDWFTQAKYRPDTPEGGRNFLLDASDRFFNERPYINHECYLFLTLKPAGNKPASSAYSNLLRKSIVPEGTVSEKDRFRLQDAMGAFMRILTDGGMVKASKLSEQELLGDKASPGLLERYLFLLSEQQTPQTTDISFKPEWKIGENFLQLFTLSDTNNLPASCSPLVNYDRYSSDKTRFSVGYGSPVGLLLPINHIYNQYMVIGDSAKTLKGMEARRRRLQSLSAYSRENTISRDATAAYLNEAIGQARTPILAHCNLLCWTSDRRELKELRNKAASALSQMEVVPHLETAGAPQIWWAGLPGNAAQLPENDCFQTFAEQASCFLNMESASRSSGSPFGIRLGDRLTGVPLHVDISDEPMARGITTNRNKVVCGSSGSGKSMFMNTLIHAYVQQGAHCVIVDVGHSYEGLCKLVGGYYFTYTEDHPIKFNPFYITEGDTLDTEKKESIKTLLVALWKANDESFRRSEYVAISNALQSYYNYLEKHPEIFACFDSFYEFLQEHFTLELERDGVKDRDFDVHNFLYVLRPFYKGGEFDFLLNAKENLDVLHQPLVIFEIDAIKDHPILFPVCTLVLCELFISKMRKLKGKRKVIVIEEAWKAISKAGMAEFMKYLYKTVRKYFGEAITVTQEVDDIISSPIIKEAIISNSDCKILLDLRKFQNKFEQIQAAFGMTDKGRDLSLSLNRSNEPGKKYREVYFELGNQLMRVYRFEPSLEEYYAFTTEQKEKLLVQEYTARYNGDIRKALRMLGIDMRSNQN